MGKEDVPIEEVSTDSPDLSYAENRRFDMLTGAGGKSDPEAWAIILGERKSSPQDPVASSDEAPSAHDTVAEARKRFKQSAEEARVANQARAEAIRQEQTDKVTDVLRETSTPQTKTQTEDQIAGDAEESVDPDDSSDQQ